MSAEATEAILRMHAPDNCPRVTGHVARGYKIDFGQARVWPSDPSLFIMSCNGAVQSPLYEGKVLPVYNQFGPNTGESHSACANCPLKVGSGVNERYTSTGEIF